jgi:hypothetical protein
MVVWHASAITGASADTMEDESLKEGWRRLGGVFSLPPVTSGFIFFGKAVSAKRGSRPAPKRIQF